MFEDRTFEKILAELLALAPEGVDTRQGSIYYDAVAAFALKLANFYVDANNVLTMISLWSATGEYLDDKGREHALTRNQATKARYYYVYEGTTPKTGARFFTDGVYFTLTQEAGELLLEAETAGESANDILIGTPATPVNTIQGLTVSQFGALYEPGANTESDDNFRRRLQEKLNGPSRNGNKAHYKTWCEEVDGVGRARIIPLWDGVNTVKAVLLDTDGLPASPPVVERVQEYIDPGGTGLGEGMANIGAYFTATAAEPVELTVSFRVSLASGYTAETAKAEAEAAIKSYLKDLALNTDDDTPVVVRVSHIGSMLYGLTPVLDYTDLTLNGQTGNIYIGTEAAAVLKEVEIVGTV